MTDPFAFFDKIDAAKVVVPCADLATPTAPQPSTVVQFVPPRKEIQVFSTPSCRQVNMFRKTVIAVTTRRHTPYWLRLQILPSSHIASPILSRTSALRCWTPTSLAQCGVNDASKDGKVKNCATTPQHDSPCWSGPVLINTNEPGRGITVTPVCLDPLIAFPLLPHTIKIVEFDLSVPSCVKCPSDTTGQWFTQQAGFPCQMLQGVVELPLINIPQFSLMSPEQRWGLSTSHVAWVCFLFVSRFIFVVSPVVTFTLSCSSFEFCRRYVTQFCKFPLWQQVVITCEGASRASLTWLMFMLIFFR